MTLHYMDEAITLHHGDALEIASMMDTGSVDCIVTSPPYFGLRDYGNPGQYGLESTPAAYVETMRALFNELLRVLADDGTLWLNLGDSYGKNKNLLGMPWQVALTLQDDGWTLRNAVIWHKPNAMPQSVTDRLSSRYEHVFMFSKSRKYWFDLDPIREQHAPATSGRNPFGARGNHYKIGRDGTTNGAGSHPTAIDGHLGFSELGRNPGDVWKIATQPFPGSHFATFPQELPRRCILAGCKPGGTVLDPFHGSGTTGLVATQLERKYIGIDINAEYLALSLDHPKRLLSSQYLTLNGEGDVG